MNARILISGFIGGFGRDSCYRMHRKQNVRYMQNLQPSYSLGFTV
jgi:hypothetical protein